ncbi:uncharacterized protein BX663DRAFT_498368 [Cokeromyces recurvatus]|uniref:uncharacterized protein n=1 Tax=Cokeromyces recurvatus TaxID=90255 RepID=UPI00221EE742|nr:uncharacterized protein BX663DRAFT_498368 [Cokeromyces recurvatus]KAI7905981.1 hypothetical protein BX663DRAFT_498368 [Cokeromyces recurvatus]
MNNNPFRNNNQAINNDYLSPTTGNQQPQQQVYQNSNFNNGYFPSPNQGYQPQQSWQQNMNTNSLTSPSTLINPPSLQQQNPSPSLLTNNTFPQQLPSTFTSSHFSQQQPPYSTFTNNNFPQPQQQGLQTFPTSNTLPSQQQYSSPLTSMTNTPTGFLNNNSSSNNPSYYGLGNINTTTIPTPMNNYSSYQQQQQQPNNNFYIPSNFGTTSNNNNNMFQQPLRHPPVDVSSLLKGTEIRRVECPVCQKMLEGDDMAINHHVNEHYT